MLTCSRVGIARARCSGTLPMRLGAFLPRGNSEIVEAQGTRRWEGMPGMSSRGERTHLPGAGTTEKSRRIASSAAGERPAILRHLRHLRHQSHLIAVNKRFASVTQNSKRLAARVTDPAFASRARPVVSVAPAFLIDRVDGVRKGTEITRVPRGSPDRAARSARVSRHRRHLTAVI